MFNNFKYTFALKKIHKTNRKILDNKRCRYCKGPCPDVCVQLLLQNRQIEFQISGAEWFDFSPPTPFSCSTKECPECRLQVLSDFNFCPQCSYCFLPDEPLAFSVTEDESIPPAPEGSPKPKL